MTNENLLIEAKANLKKVKKELALTKKLLSQKKKKPFAKTGTGRVLLKTGVVAGSVILFPFDLVTAPFRYGTYKAKTAIHNYEDYQLDKMCNKIKRITNEDTLHNLSSDKKRLRWTRKATRLFVETNDFLKLQEENSLGKTRLEELVVYLKEVIDKYRVPINEAGLTKVKKEIENLVENLVPELVNLEN